MEMSPCSSIISPMWHLCGGHESVFFSNFTSVKFALWHWMGALQDLDWGEIVSDETMSVIWGRYHGGRRSSSDDSFHHNSTIGTRQTEYHEALPLLVNVQSHLTSSFADHGNASWCSVCQMLMVEWRSYCENCRYLMVVGLHDTNPRCLLFTSCTKPDLCCDTAISS